jgi:BirA family biotin operon repressor/biotin-[acetyl-CoA-carboxylase] ligase
MLTGREVDLRESLHSLLEHILTWYQMLRTRQYRQIRESYLNGMYGRGRSLTYRSGERRFTAEVEGVDDYGQLLLKDRAGVITTWPFKGVELLL